MRHGWTESEIVAQLRLGLRCRQRPSLNELVTMRITSIRTQTPRPPRVCSMRIPVTILLTYKWCRPNPPT